ncbi:MAG: cell division protein ZipA C-terminal FtsZ-binding domain-containing protein [Rhodoferax sp.]
MNQLQLGLLVVGGAVLLAMVCYNLWLSWQNRPARPSAGASPDFAAQEPTLDVESLADGGFVLPVPEKKPGLDALIDVIAPIALEAHVAGEAVLAALPPTRRIGSKPFAVEGLNTVTERWEAAQAGQRYSQLQAGLQLSNRSGALNDIEFSEFVMKTQNFCDVLGGTPDFPDMRAEVGRARELDQFANEHDAQLGFVLRAKRVAWSPSYIVQLASKMGFVAGPMAGRMLLPASLAAPAPVLSLSFDTQAALADDPTQSALRELTLSLEVPHVDRSERPFARMREIASAMARTMDGVVTDDKGVLVQADAMDVIAAELERLYDTLDQRELSAGSALARRLFS